MNAARHLQRGFTLAELLTAVAVAGVLAALAVPSFSGLIYDQRMSNDTSDLMITLSYARTEASRRRRTVSICPSANGTSCSGTQWENGYIVFVNNDADDPAVVDSGEEVVRVINGGSDNVTVRADTFSSFISFAPTSFSNAAGTFTICDQRGATSARGVLINAVGRPRRGEDNDADGIEEDRNGNKLSC